MNTPPVLIGTPRGVGRSTTTAASLPADMIETAGLNLSPTMIETVPERSTEDRLAVADGPRYPVVDVLGYIRRVRPWAGVEYTQDATRVRIWVRKRVLTRTPPSRLRGTRRRAATTPGGC